MKDLSFSESVKSVAVKKALTYLNDKPQKAIPNLIDWIGRFDRKGVIEGQLRSVKEALEDPSGNWARLVKSLWTDIDDGVRARMFENFVLNATVISGERQTKIRAEHCCNLPWAILIDPTSACNMHCTGCWAAEYGNKLNLSYDELKKIITEGRQLGTFMYIYTGGEPLMRKKDLLRLCEEFPDCQFLAFTNGTLIDEAFADELLRVKNFVPAISVEGNEEETDFRRGKGAYKAVCRAMDILRRKKLPFGASVCYTRKNVDSVGSEKFFDFMIDKGCKFTWFFTYMPIGNGAPTDLMATAEQREKMYHNIREFRKTKPLFTMDFWNDGEYVRGCIAGGRCYLHINANGDVEPCVFIHYSDSNIREKTLLEAYCSPLFMEYAENQPFSDNYLRPCPLLDNKDRLADIVHATGAYSTDVQQQEDVDALCAKCHQAADNWEPVANRLWVESGSAERMKEKNKKSSLYTPGGPHLNDLKVSNRAVR